MIQQTILFQQKQFVDKAGDGGIQNLPDCQRNIKRLNVSLPKEQMEQMIQNEISFKQISKKKKLRQVITI